MKRSKILIVGAGPIGLTLALLLHHYGIQVEIIDKLTERSPFSRALTLTSASLKVFQGLGIADKLLAQGRTCSRAEIFFNKKRVAFIDKKSLNSLFNYYLSIPQPLVENILETELKSQGIEIQYCHTLTDLVQDKNSVTATIINAVSQQTRVADFDYVIGCDGAHSPIRKLLGLTFSGPDYPVHFILADVKFKENNPPSCATYYVNQKGFTGLFPMETGYTRVVVQKNGTLPEHEPSADLNEIQPYLDEYLPEKSSAYDCVWSSKARIIGRIANHCRVNRVFLAGDAWHLFSPVGGQTMNTGLQDVFDLGWKLAYVLQNKAPDTLLDSYENERMLAAKKVLAITDHYTNLIIGVSNDKKAMQQFIPQIHNRKTFKDLLPYLFSGYHADYCKHETDIIGQHVPYLKLNSLDNINSTYDLPLLKKYSLFFLSNNTDTSLLTLSSSCNQNVTLFEINPSDTQTIEQLALNKQNLCLISPGGYIVAHGDKAQIGDYLSTVLT